jgi:hypothetical protein
MATKVTRIYRKRLKITRNTRSFKNKAEGNEGSGIRIMHMEGRIDGL